MAATGTLVVADSVAPLSHFSKASVSILQLLVAEAEIIYKIWARELGWEVKQSLKPPLGEGSYNSSFPLPVEVT